MLLCSALIEVIMKDEDRKTIEEIMAGMNCPKNFKCAENGFEHLCRAKDLRIESYLECLEDKPSMCSFAISFGSSHFCECPLRVYLAKELKK